MKTIIKATKIDMLDCGTFKGLYIVRNRLYKISIRLENSIGSSRPHSKIYDKDSDCLVWDNIDALENVSKEGRTKAKTRYLLKQEIEIMEGILKKLEV